jgi:large subunit ribosomal protein L25
MDTIKLAVREREETGNGPARRLRAEGRIPGVTYAKGAAATAISIGLEELRVALAHGQNVVLELQFERGAKSGAKGGSRSRKAAARYAVVKELQFHPTRRRLLHIDLHEVDLAVEIEASVAIELVGKAAGAIEGGVLDWEHREVTVRALPGDIPSVLQLDVSELEIGQHEVVGSLTAPEGVVIVDDPETVVATVLPPRVEAVTAEEEEEELLEEPEVIGEGEAEAEPEE